MNWLLEMAATYVEENLDDPDVIEFRKTVDRLTAGITAKEIVDAIRKYERYFGDRW